LDPLAVIRRDTGRGLGVEFRELGVQRRPAEACGPDIELGPKLRGGGGELGETVKERP